MSKEHKVEILKYSEKKIKRADGSFINIPKVMRLLEIVRRIYRAKVPWNRKNVLTRDRNRCMYCGRKDRSLTIDHVFPQSRGGTTSFENCVASCFECNNQKGNRTPREAGMKLIRQPFAPTIAEFVRIKMTRTGITEFLQEIGVY
jgi:5-methylcytosine-specific restriction endonuclease McrA